MKTSRVLWEAANKYLWDGVGERVGYGCRLYACDAICAAEMRCRGPALLFAEELGCPVDSLCAFDEFEDRPSQQGARYAWLMFASMYAAELEARGEL